MSNEFLQQDEIDAVLQNMSSSASIQNLTEIERDTLAEIGNISMGSAATALSTLINKKVTITVPDVRVSTFAEVQRNYPIPCIIVNVEYKAGLQGSNMLVIKERDASVIGSLMMGLSDDEIPDTVDEITLSAVSEAMNVMMGSAATAMSDLFRYKIDISPPETTRKHLGEDVDIIPQDGVYVIIAFHLHIPDLVDSTMLQVIDINFAREMVANLFDSDMDSQASSNERVKEETLATQTWNDLKGGSEAEPKYDVNTDLGNLNIELIKDIPVQIRAVLGRTRMSIENILKLGPGHIMELDTLDGEPIDVYANDTLIARGEVVVVGEQFGVRITEISTPRNRIQSIR